MRGWKPWTVQPPAGTPIDWSNPLADGLIFVYVPNNCGFDLVSGETGTAVASVATPLRAGAAGVTGDWTATSSLAYANNGYFNPPTVSVMAYVRANAAPATNTGILSEQFSGTPARPSYGLVLNYGGNLEICFSILQAEAQAGPIFPYTPPVNASVVLMGTYNGAEAALYAAGVPLAQKAVTGAPQSGTGAGNSLIVSGSSDSAVATAFSGDIYCGAVWKRGLLGSEVERLSANPWQFFHKRRRSYSIVQSSGVTASAAILEQPDAINAAATASTSASASILEQPDSIAASASFSTTASAAIVEHPDTLAANAALTVPASAAVTESADSIAAAASASITASAAIVEGYDTLAGTLNVGTTVNALADIAEQYDAISASATLSAAAVASIREGRDILSAAAAFALSTTAAILESVDTLAASAQASISASANAYSGCDVLVASATVGSSTSAAANILAGYDIIQASAIVLSPVDAACTVTLLQLLSTVSVLR